MDFLDIEILDVVPLSVIPGEAPDSNHPMDASASACPTQGNSSSIPSSSTHATSSKEDMHHTDRVIRNLVTIILNEGHSDIAAEGLCSLGKTVSGKKFVASTTANASQSEKHDSANNVIDLEDDRSDDQDDNLLHHLNPSMAKRMKTRKGRSVAEMMTTGVGPSKSWSKVDVKKRKVREISESDGDVEENVPDISLVKRTTVRKFPVKVAVVHLDNISFHLKDGAAKWKFVIQRRVVVERELGKDVVEVKEVMDIIKNTGLMKTVAGLSQCYQGLVKEFIINIYEDIADKNSKEFCKVFVRGKCITFSPTVINMFLGRGIEGACELEATDNKVCREIIARRVKEWPSKKHLPVGKLTVKYAILHKIGSANWVPTNHISIISNTLGRFIFVVGTKLKFDYGRFMFEQIVKHAFTNIVKLPIDFPSMICGTILSQHPGILSTNDLPSRRKPALSVHYKFFEGSHVEDIVMTFAVKKPAPKGGLLAKLKEICKELGARIRVATTRKESLEALIASLEQAEGDNIE
ncbi:uncharacterized protein LOC127080523 [Lathyrus oleraceus]|uniref:uncharacterized protein LOC127080523 n=1 Tax=Pisum sativum TaxID=3888 RepID=UPI0021D1126B|nr:uncharacterized protein LOC127080523 [Pisum sativum]